ncbi:DUF3806 domain-containing protein [Cellulomonas sp. JZ18]|uniref:DUF3806 domain-containing protein n=1 Tax=Cellulomonas sp. JZ18 TaxID=2654191 RepID=UPI0012D45406|nr:DUF3806 domain-containing protein [Cellulomonas sp. JZ18]QGQ20530.1 DUF3806 domain-containing protein [Cellulomonas sp. JZ18]
MTGPRRPAPAPQVSPLSEAEAQWCQDQLAVAGVLAEAYAGDGTTPPSLTSLDAVVAGWHGDDRGIDVNTVVNAVGVAFGEHVARDTGLSWVIATDEHGTDLALHGRPGDLLLHPANAVAKRVVEGRTPFVAALHAEVVAAVRRVRPQP